MPTARVTKTTSVIGRKVPVPRRWMVNGFCAEATVSRYFSTSGSASVRISVEASSSRRRMDEIVGALTALPICFVWTGLAGLKDGKYWT